MIRSGKSFSLISDRGNSKERGKRVITMDVTESQKS
jgi:hypothetical protein